MKKFLISCVMTLFGMNTYSQQAIWKEVQSYNESQSYISAPKIAPSKNGSKYIAGTFYGPSATFGSNVITTIANEGAYVARFDKYNNPIWVRGFGTDTIGYSYGFDVATDQNENVYVTGYFAGYMTIDSATTIYAYGIVNIFLIKLDSSGNVVWHKVFGGLANSFGTALAADNEGNIFLAGEYYWDAYFDTFTLGFNNLSANIFLAKIDAISGLVINVSEVDGNGIDDLYCYSLCLSDQNLFMSGGLDGTAIFGTNSISSSGEVDGFVAKYDLDCNNLWVRKFGSPVQNDIAFGITSDESGNVYAAGTTHLSSSFGNGVSLSCSIHYTACIVKYDSMGICQWAKKMGGYSQDGYAMDIASDENGNTVVTGMYLGTGNFSPHSITSAGYYDSFTAKYDAMGGCLWASSGGSSSGDDYGYDVAYDIITHTFLVAGTYAADTAIFGSTSLAVPIGANYACYIAGVSDPIGMGVPFVNPGNISIYPNPTSDFIYIDLENENNVKNVTMYNIHGQLVKDMEIEKRNSQIKISVRDFPKGVYMIKVNNSAQKILIQ